VAGVWLEPLIREEVVVKFLSPSSSPVEGWNVNNSVTNSDILSSSPSPFSSSSPLTSSLLSLSNGVWLLSPSGYRVSKGISSSLGGRGMGRTRKKPRIIGSAVPIANRSRKDDVSPAKNTWEMVENRKADRPRPEITSPLADARYKRNKEKGCETWQSDKTYNIPCDQGKFSQWC